jgi:uncharacterized membrane protein
MKYSFIFTKSLPLLLSITAVLAAMLVGWQAIRVELVVLYELGLFIILLQQVAFITNEYKSTKEVLDAIKSQAAAQ